MQKEISNLSKKLAKAFNTNTLIAPLPKKFCTNTKNANLLRVASEKLIKSPVIGFKAGATGKAMLKKWKEKEPFYASIFKKNLIKTNSAVNLSKNTFRTWYFSSFIMCYYKGFFCPVSKIVSVEDHSVFLIINLL